MRQLTIIGVILICFNLISFSQIKGKYCCDDNWTRIDFKTSDSLTIIKPFYYSSHIPAYGEGTYKIKNDSLHITYYHKHNTYYKMIFEGNQDSNSNELTINFKDTPRFGVRYFNDNDSLSILPNSKLTIKRQNNSLLIESLYSYLIIPSFIINNKNVTGLEIHMDNEPLINEKNDRIFFKILNDSEIILYKRILKKDNCDKKSSPIY